VEVTEGVTTDLPIPATAEVVLEGEMLPPDEGTQIEGPFGEMSGYYGGGARPAPVTVIKSVLYRNDPIILGSPPGRPPAELGWYRSYLRSALIWDEMEKAGVPDVKGVWLTVSGGRYDATSTSRPNRSRTARAYSGRLSR